MALWQQAARLPHAQSLPHWEEIVALARSTGDRFRMLSALYMCAICTQQEGQSQRANRMIDEALELARQISPRFGVACVLFAWRADL